MEKATLRMRITTVSHTLSRLFINAECDGSRILGPTFVDFAARRYEEVRGFQETQPQIVKCAEYTLDFGRGINTDIVYS